MGHLGGIHRSEQSEHHITKPADKSITVVDDDDAVRDSLCVMLTLAGLQVTSCRSGAALLQHLKQVTPDCLVLDVHMPRMTGLELVERLNKDGYDIPVILISGNLDATTEAQARRLGVVHLLKKPFSGATLIKIVKGVINTP
jgi:two-component system, LuxR family, response regulator FixJ